jgi:superkiller protein 3
MSAKAALKLIVTAIKAEKYDDAIKDAEKLLASDPKNHQA